MQCKKLRIEQERAYQRIDWVVFARDCQWDEKSHKMCNPDFSPKTPAFHVLGFQRVCCIRVDISIRVHQCDCEHLNRQMCARDFVPLLQR